MAGITAFLYDRATGVLGDLYIFGLHFSGPEIKASVNFGTESHRSRLKPGSPGKASLFKALSSMSMTLAAALVLFDLFRCYYNQYCAAGMQK